MFGLEFRQITLVRSTRCSIVPVRSVDDVERHILVWTTRFHALKDPIRHIVDHSVDELHVSSWAVRGN
ncbi:hypothetical protein BST17_24760 [Mycolicibacterium bacteremicum]|uniref:Uncharacterized protein n=1 Tax=Mycolicibacterium bacteremicum TaxID=564198 RepID=A0A1W9YPX8_MYCBA|nr:hypothetical protein BST17_24760 [Mycolicibacterium bacteremicum]